MKKYAPQIIFAIATLHTLVGLFFGAAVLGEIAQDGFFNTIAFQFDREAIFWFLMTGILLYIIGGLIRWMQRENGRLPGWRAWSFWLIGLPSVILMPASGLWSFFLIGWLVRQNHAQKPLPNPSLPHG